MPVLHTTEGLASSRDEKEQALRKKFFPSIEADLTDIHERTFQENTFANPLDSPQEATEDEVQRVIS